MSEGPTIGDWTQYGWIPDDASSFPARVRLRDAAWMVYYEPDTVVQRERAENAKLRELVDYMTPIALYAASEHSKYSAEGNGAYFYIPNRRDNFMDSKSVLAWAEVPPLEVDA